MQGLRDTPPVENINNLSDHEKLKRLVMFAHLAPSTRNTQPWSFLIGEKTIEIRPNMKRQLFLSDPSGREVYLSVGTAVANLLLAAEAYGIQAHLTYHNVDNLCIVKISFEKLDLPNSYKKELLEGIIHRHNNRSLYEPRPLSSDFFELIKSIEEEFQIKAHVVTDEVIKGSITQILNEATSRAFSDKKFMREAANWLRPSIGRFRDGMPGYNMGIPTLVSLILPTLVKFVNISKTQIAMNEKWMKNSSGIVILSSNEDNPQGWLTMGQAFEKLVILAGKSGVRHSILAALIEVDDYYKKLQAILGSDVRPQMFFRVGYTKEVPKFSPRLPLSEVVKTA
jgi:nitroreductase